MENLIKTIEEAEKEFKNKHCIIAFEDNNKMEWDIIPTPEEVKIYNRQSITKVIEGLYSHLVSIEAKTEKENWNSDYKKGYFQAIDDVVKFIEKIN